MILGCLISSGIINFHAACSQTGAINRPIGILLLVNKVELCIWPAQACQLAFNGIAVSANDASPHC